MQRHLQTLETRKKISRSQKLRHLIKRKIIQYTMLSNFNKISEAMAFSGEMLKIYGQRVNTEKWQGIPNQFSMIEFLNLYWAANIPHDLKNLRLETKPDLPWADIHFEERVGGIPLNPGESYKKWPYYKNKDFNDKNFRNLKMSGGGYKSVEVEEKFTHTYMERYWPKFTGEIGKNIGIRYEYGDLKDVVNLLKKEPNTRQAYLPVWFPEDTGVLHGGRVPCSIGYHFIMRNNKLNIHYMLRSCDMVRHFKNDIYLTCLLVFWVLNELTKEAPNMGEQWSWHDVKPGLLTMDIVSLHCFEIEKNLI